jgi:hypothetical protein
MSHYQYVTDAALLKLGDDSVRLLRRLENFSQYFNGSYEKQKGCNDPLKVWAAAEGSFDGEFQTSGCKVRHFVGYKNENFSLHDLDKPEQRYERMALLQASKDKGKQSFLEGKLLNAVHTFSMIAAQVHFNKEAMDYFQGKPFAVAVTRRSTERIKNVLTSCITATSQTKP